MLEDNQEKVDAGEKFQLRQASSGDLDKVWTVIKSCSDWLVTTKGFRNWQDYYSREKVEKKIKNQEVYLASSAGEVVGTITLDTSPVEYFTKEDMSTFAEPSAKALYVTALGVLPDHQGKGIAGKLMQFADTEAKKRNINYLRFDCRAGYKELIRFYVKRGYMKVGFYLDEGDNDEEYWLMEKKIE